MIFSLFSVITVLAAGGVASAPAPANFAGIPWNVSVEEAKSAMKTANGAAAGDASGNELAFKGGRFGGQPAMEWSLRFEKDAFTEGTVVLNGRGRALFDTVRSVYAKQFGEPTQRTRPDGSVQCAWHFSPDPVTGDSVLVLCSYHADSRDARYRSTTRVTFKYKPSDGQPADPLSAELAPVGSWRWNDHTLSVLQKDGTVESDGMNGTWKWTDEPNGLLQITWDDATVQPLVLSADWTRISKPEEKTAKPGLSPKSTLKTDGEEKPEKIFAMREDAPSNFFGVSSESMAAEDDASKVATPTPTPSSTFQILRSGSAGSRPRLELPR